MINRELGFGIIGCGKVSNWHADAILRIKDTQLKGVTDVSEQARKAFSEKYDIKAFETAEELLACPGIDIVCICTPSGLHAPLAVTAADAGKHVIVEKPMAINLKQADEIIAACKRNNVKLEVISQLRFADAVRKLKGAIEEELLGRLVTGDIYMKYYRSQEYYNTGGWRGTWEMDGGGALMNQGIHGIDLLLYIMGPVKSVFAITRTLARNIEVEDTAVAVVEFRNGALGVIEGTTSIYPGMPRRLEISGDRGTIVLEEDCIASWAIEGRELPADVKLGHTESMSSSNPFLFDVEGHLKQISDMAGAVRNGGKPMVDQYEGRKPIELIMAIYESSRTGKVAQL